jgi:acyl carrier protein
MDQQVKIRGFRIEPGEIEAALSELPQVREAAVVVREDVPGEKRLVAYVVPSPDEEVAPAGLRDRLSGRLPEYMVPSAYVLLERLPLSANGKLDRRALPAPEKGSGAAYVAPRTATEEVLAGIWAEVLGLERAGVEENFFELGGHSLLATQVVSRARQAFGVEVPLRTLFEAPTVAALAGCVEELRSAGAAVAPPIERVPRTGPLPLSFAQQRLWFIDRLEPGSPAYNIPFPLRLRGRLGAAALGAALTEVVARHEALRTVFDVADGAPVQVVLAAGEHPLPRVDLRHLPATRAEAEVRRLAAADARRPFDLARGPLLRTALVQLAGDDHALLASMHHVVSDGWSMQVLTREISALYAAFRRGEEPRLPELPVQYADFAVWQRAWMSGETLEGQIGYWKEKLGGAPPLLEIPTDRPRAPGLSPRAGTRRLALPAGVAQALRGLSRREGATLFMTLLAGFQGLLSRYAGQDDVVVGTPIAGRNRRETEGLIGFFVNMLALRADLSGDPQLDGAAGAGAGDGAGSVRPPGAPLRAAGGGAGGGAQPGARARVPGGLHAEPRRGSGRAAAGGRAGAGKARGRAGSGQVRPGPGVRGRGGGAVRLHRVPRRAVRGGHGRADGRTPGGRAGGDGGRPRAAPLGAVAAARDRARAGAARLERHRAGLPRTPLPARAVRRAGTAHPRAPAVVSEGQTLTYAELDAGADRLAHLLRRRGVGPETRVAICLERHPAMVLGRAGRPQGGRRLRPAGPGLSRRARRLRARRLRCLAGADADPPGGALRPGGVPLLALDALQAELARSPPGRPRAAPRRTTWRTSSTLPARRGSPRACWCSTAPW